ncbi:hypothetical protein HMPREF1870_00442 [Bacteroidales bacterium KA00344]|nr:hypothetical protein HMPREF1870_00442 [Bacteroidales bacterium KA00344]
MYQVHPIIICKNKIPFFGHYFQSIQREKGYVSALTIFPKNVKTAPIVRFVFRPIMAEA